MSHLPHNLWQYSTIWQMVPWVLLCLKADLHQRKDSSSSAPSQPKCKQQKCISRATADQLLSNYIYNRRPYLFHLQMHLLKCRWWVCCIQNSKAFQIEWIPGANKLTWRQSYWVASWSYSIKLSTKTPEYITEKNTAWILLKGGKKPYVLYFVMVHQSFPVSPQRPNGYQISLFLIIFIKTPLNLWVRSFCGF